MNHKHVHNLKYRSLFLVDFKKKRLKDTVGLLRMALDLDFVHVLRAKREQNRIMDHYCVKKK